MIAQTLGRKLTLKVRRSSRNLKNGNEKTVSNNSNGSANARVPPSASNMKNSDPAVQRNADIPGTVGSTSNVNSTQEMKGLQIFIADLRSCQNSKQDHETKINMELTTIMKQFESSKHLNGYRIKKSLCKLIYVYLTTNCSRSDEISFAFPKMVQLMQNTKYSEKFIGYFGTQLFLPYLSAQNITPTAIQNCLKDLDSDNEEFAVLALNFIANGCSNFTDINDVNDCMERVFQHVRSPTSSDLLKHKSNLTFYALLRINPAFLSSMDIKKLNLWIQRISALIDNDDILLSTLPLIKQIMVIVGTSFFKNIIPQLTKYLFSFYDKQKYVDSTNTSTTSVAGTKYNINNNWIVIKILEVLSMIIDEHDVSVIDMQTFSKLRLAVSKAIQICSEPTTTSIQRINQSAVLFAFVNFTKKLDPSSDSQTSSIKSLTHLFHTTKDINLKYMTLDTLYNISRSTAKDERGNSSIVEVLDSEESIWETGFSSKSGSITKTSPTSHVLMLDSSIIGKWIDLIFEITYSENIKKSINWLLTMMDHPEVISSIPANGLTSTSKLDLKQDISFKISILIEKYATDVDWFIDISLELLSKIKVNDDDVTRNNGNDSLWERLVQIVINNESLHFKVSQLLLAQYLHDPNASENITKVGCYLLGEFVSLVVPKLITSHDLLNLFTAKYFQSQQVSTRALISTSMMKLYKQDISLGSVLIKFYQLELNSLDLELQTRCVSYLSIIQQTMQGNHNLLDILFQPAPFFQTMDNPLLARLTTIKPAPVAGPHSKISRMNSTISANLTGNSSLNNRQNSHTNMSTPPLAPAPRKFANRSSFSSLSADSTAIVGGREKYNSLVLVSDYRTSMKRMIEHKQGVLYQNTLSKPIKILYSTRQCDGSSTASISTTETSTTTRYILTFVNGDQDYDISSFYCSVVPSQTSDNPPYFVKTLYIPESNDIPRGKRLTFQFDVQIRKPFSVWDSPILNVQYKLGSSSFSELNIKLGVSLTSTIIPNTDSVLSIPQYIQRWKQIGDMLGADGEYSKEITHNASNPKLDIQAIKQLLNKKLGLDLIESNSDHATIKHLIFASSIIHTKSDGKFGILIKILFDIQKENWIVTCRSTAKGEIARSIVESIVLCIT